MKIFYGWVIVLALSLTQLVSWGALYYTFGVLLPLMQDELGWPRTTLAGGFSLALLVAGLAAVPVGRWVDQRGTRWLMTAGSVLSALALLGWSQVRDLGGYYIVWVALGVASATTLYEPAFAAVATWFRAGRRRALAVLTFFGGLASLVFIPLMERLAQAYGWRGALVALAVIVAALTIPPHALLLRARPSDLGLEPDGRPAPPGEARAERSLTLGEALRGRTFWLLGSAISLTTLLVTTLNVYLISYLVERGYPSSFAALAAGLHGIMSVSGRLTVAPLSARWSLARTIAGLYAMEALAVAVLLLVPGEVGVLAYVVIFGVGSGAATPIRAALVAERYGSASYGRITGALQTTSLWARVVAPVGAGLLAAQIGFGPLLWGLAIAAALAAALAAAA